MVKGEPGLAEHGEMSRTYPRTKARTMRVPGEARQATGETSVTTGGGESMGEPVKVEEKVHEVAQTELHLWKHLPHCKHHTARSK